MKTWVYVDGLNLYYGSLKRTPFRWLDLRRLCGALLPHHKIERIKYFTARIIALPGDPDAPTRQDTYLRALRTLPDLEIYFGHFLSHTVTMALAQPMPGLPPLVRVIRTDEKGSDVNLASHLLHDGHLQRYEMAVILSGDSDLLAPVSLVMNDLKKIVGVLNPQKRTCWVLANQATFYRHIRKGVLAASQFPPTLTDAVGKFHKPPAW
jgi:hypothetical protein